MSLSKDAWGERLPRSLGLLSALCVLVGTSIGSGIFRVPALVAQHIQDTSLFTLAWLLGGVVALCGALSLAELATAMPRSGGVYVYIRKAFGDWPAFLYGWCELIVLRPSAYGALAITASEYLWKVLSLDGALQLGPLPVSRAQLTAALMILTLGAINAHRMSLSAALQNLSTLFKLAALLGLVVLGLVLTPAQPPASVVSVGAGTSWMGFGLAMVSILWTYEGWSNVGHLAGEIRAPHRVLPRVFILGTSIIIALYLVVNALYVHVISLAAMPRSSLIAADVATTLLGPIGAKVVSAAVMISTFGALNGVIMAGPRVCFALAEDRLFFQRFAMIHPVHGTPTAAIAFSSFLGVCYVASRTFAELTNSFIIGIWPFYILAVLAVFRLRQQHPKLERPYRVVGYPVTPLLFIAASVSLLLNYAVHETRMFVIDVAIIASGIPIYWLVRRARRAEHALA